MIPMLRPLALVLCLLGVLPAQAEALRPFVAGSAQALRAARADRPFVLALWSLTCSHCQEELALLGRLRAQYPALDVVLVSTDAPEDAAALGATLARHGLTRTEAWVFADPFTEILRQEIDPRWRIFLTTSFGYLAYSGFVQKALDQAYAFRGVDITKVQPVVIR